MICVHFFWSCQSRWILKHNAVTPLPSCAPSTVNVLLNLSDAGVIPQWLQCYNKVGEAEKQRKCNLGHVEFLSM